MTLAIDIGNSRTKAALFAPSSAGPSREPILERLWMLETGLLEKDLPAIVDEASTLCHYGQEPLRIGWCSVSYRGKLDFSGGAIPVTHLTTASALPIANAYTTPQTLGIDRIVAVIAAREQTPSSPVLVIDAGTAITYDVADAGGTYLGGGIAPGLAMRYRALNVFTARLPLVGVVSEEVLLVGDSTEASIRSGVQNGILAEVEGIIARYRTAFGANLQVFLAGGDAPFFSAHLKTPTFAAPHLVLYGIYHILNE